MNRRLGRTTGLLALALVGTLWFWLTAPPELGRFRSPIEPKPMPRVTSQDALQSAAPSTSQPPPPPQPAPSIPECLSATAWAIDAACAAHFGLTDTEVAAVNTVLADTIAELNALELKNLVVEYESPKTSFFRIEPFFREGESLKDKAFSDLAGALPAKEAAATAVQQALAHRGLMARGDFGGRATEFKVTALAPPANDRFRYEVYQREFLGPTPVFETRDQRLPAGSIVSEEVLSFSTVPERLQHLLDRETTEKE